MLPGLVPPADREARLPDPLRNRGSECQTPPGHARIYLPCQAGQLGRRKRDKIRGPTARATLPARFRRLPA
eukprot:6734340-Alexandrium_andersonii.AAC.1